MHAPLCGRGFALIVIVLLITVGAILAAAIAFVFVSGSQSSTLHLVAKEGLMIAEAGLEYATRQYGTGAAPCARAAPETQNFDDGAFTIEDANSPATFDPTMDFDNVTPLPPGQCRIRVTGTYDDAARTAEVIVAGGGGGGIAVDNQRDANSTTWNHQVGAGGTNRLLLVGLSLRNSLGQDVTGVTYDGVAMQPLGELSNGNEVRVELWYLADPNTGNNQVAATVNPGGERVVGGSVSFTGVDIGNPIDGAAVFASGAANPSVGITPTIDNAFVIDTVASRTAVTMVAQAGRVEQWNRHSGGNAAARVYGAGSTRGPISPPAPLVMNWNAGSNWAMGAVAIRPAGGATRIAWREVFP